MSGGAARPDIAGREDIAALILDFYGRAFHDDLLGPVFVDVARLDLEAHLPIMCDFWETVLFRAGKYKRNALRVHADLHARAPLGAEHFERWLRLWRATVDDRHHGPRADFAKLQAERIAGSIDRRLNGQAAGELFTPRRRPDSLPLAELPDAGGPHTATG